MKRQRAGSVMRAVQRTALVLFTLWVAIHTVIVWKTGWSPWRLGGLGMYSKPGAFSIAAAVVVCESSGCEPELRMVSSFAPTPSRIYNVPVLTRAHTTTGYATLHADLPGGASAGVRRFLNFPSAANADVLVRTRLTEACGPYLAVHYHQHVSLITRRATVDARPFTVSYPGTRCASRPRVIPVTPR